MTPSIAPQSIATKRLLLRPFIVDDAVRVVEIQSNWNVTRMLRMAPYPPDLTVMADWLASHAAEWRAGSAYRYAVTIGGTVIGCADVDEIVAGSGELGYWLDEAWWGGGLAHEAAEAVLRVAVASAGLTRLTSGHAADNPASGRVLTKLGFHRTGETEVWSKPRQCQIRQISYALGP